ncbi:MAG: hypothetical protein EB127_02195 [Alphaproteobacteria bacterium]|nr:hypothetical protein [Alphaproteobacteria bacterium]
MPPVYTSQYFGTGGGIVSVSTFANLPATATTGQRISITDESSLFNTTTYPAIVRWSGTAWQLESAAATYLNVAAVEFASGIWTGIGGVTVSTKSGALLRDTTYNEVWIWNSTSNIFVPRYLGLTTVNNQQKIKGNSATLSGWSTTLGTGSTITTDGSKLIFTATSSSGASSVNRIFFTDTAGTGTTNNFYMKCLYQRTTWTRATTGGLDIYIRHDTGYGGRIVEFGDADTSFATTFNGRFADRTTGAGVGYTATANRGDTGWQSETLVQFRVIAGVAAQVKIGTGGWHDIAVGICRSGAGTLRFEFGVTSNNSGSNIATGKVRYLQAIRYT